MIKELFNILNQKQFKSIIDCIEYLYLVGYPLSEAYDIARILYETKLSFDLTPLTYDDYHILKHFHNCNVIFLDHPFGESNTKLYLKKNNTTMFELDLNQRKLWVKGPFPYATTKDVDIYSIINKYMNINGYKIIFYIEVTPNNNGRLYDREVLLDQIRRYNEVIDINIGFGQLDHPDSNITISTSE